MRASQTYLADQLGAATGMWQCEALSEAGRPSPSPPMHQYQVGLADGMGQLQQISDLPVGCRLPRCGELGWITHHPQDVELAQIVDV